MNIKPTEEERPRPTSLADVSRWLQQMPYAFGIALLAALLGACTPKPKEHHESRPLMGTVVAITVSGADEMQLQRAVGAAYQEMNRLSDMMNHYDPNSVVSAINTAAGKEAVAAPRELREVLAMAHAVSARTNGAFDITVGSLRGWRFNPRDPQMPSATNIERQRTLIDYRDVVVDEAAGTVMLKRAEQRIDLGGIAKLYILKAGMDVLARHGIERALINGGGDVVARGGSSVPWRIGIRDPTDTEKLLGVLEVASGYVVSSGDYERYFIRDGKRYHHIIDPRTGYPAQGPHHVTLISERMEDVNGISTSIMVLGADTGRRMVAQSRGLDALIVDRDGKAWMTEGLRARLRSAPAREAEHVKP